MQRRSLLKGIFAAGVAPLFIPNMKVWTPTTAIITTQSETIDTLLAGILDTWNQATRDALQSHLRNNLNVVYGLTGTFSGFTKTLLVETSCFSSIRATEGRWT